MNYYCGRPDHTGLRKYIGEFESWTWKEVQHSEQGLVGHPSRSLEDDRVKINMDYGDPDQEVSERKQ